MKRIRFQQTEEPIAIANATPKCQYDDALGSPERIGSRAERLPFSLDPDRLAPGR